MGVAVAGLQDVGRLQWSDIRVFEELTYLCRLRKKKRLQPWVIPSRKYLARKTGFCVTTISRSTNRLVAQGLLRKTQRRPVRGIYQTCLYKPVQRKFWRLAATLGKLWNPDQDQAEKCRRKLAHRVTPLSLKHSTIVERITPQNKKDADLSSLPPLLERLPLLQTWLERGKVVRGGNRRFRV